MKINPLFMSYFLLALILLCITSCSDTEIKPDNPAINSKVKPISTLDLGAPPPEAFEQGIYQFRYIPRYYFEGGKYEGSYCYPTKRSVKYPLAIILQGSGFSWKQYSKLQKHLASYGIASASIKWDTDTYDKNELTKHINWLYDKYFRTQGKLTNSIALIGHSRGGEYAISSAQKVETSTGKDVKSIICLAPTLFKKFNQEFNLQGLSRSLLVMYSTNDEDVFGAKLPDGRIKSGFKYYDEASSEGTSLSSSAHNRIDKDMIYFRSAPHSVYSDKVSGDLNTTINGYVLANLKLYLEGVHTYGSYFKKQYRLNVPYTGKFYQQHADYYKYVLANFENNSIATNTAGGDIIRSNGIDMWVGDSWSIDSRSPHFTKAMRINWKKPDFGVPFIRFKYPSVTDLSKYKYLSLRAGQIFGHANNQKDQDQDFIIRLKDDKGNWSSVVKISDHGELPYPPERFVSSPATDFVPVEVTRNAMSSILIPVDAFKNINLDKVKEVRLLFSVKGHTKGAVIIDNLEFYK